jgi:hypothetical protein
VTIRELDELLAKLDRVAGKQTGTATDPTVHRAGSELVRKATNRLPSLRRMWRAYKSCLSAMAASAGLTVHAQVAFLQRIGLRAVDPDHLLENGELDELLFGSDPTLSFMTPTTASHRRG